MVSRTASFGRRTAPALQPAYAGAVARKAAPAAPPVAVHNPPGRARALLARIPLLTLVIAYILTTRFHAELAAATDFTAPGAPGHFTLLAMGGADWTQVFGHGEWWRLFTASALHASTTHLLGNQVTLLLVGFLLEPMIGIGWFAAIYFTGAFVGQLTSTLMNPPGTLSVGASGAIMATLAALFTLSFHAGANRPAVMRRVALSSIVPALAPAVGSHIDVYDHLGGCLAGAGVALLMLIAWNEEVPAPPGRSLATMVAGIWVTLTVWAFALSEQSYGQYAPQGLDYARPSELPRTMQAVTDNSYALARKYPRDPRVLLLRGLYFLGQRQAADAEPYLRDAVRLGEQPDSIMPMASRSRARALLALDLEVQHRTDEARSVGAPACADSTLDANLHKALDKNGLCG